MAIACRLFRTLGEYLWGQWESVILFLDTEFTGLDHPNPGLVSLALVSELGDFFYAELPPADYLHQASSWVRSNILPLLWGGRWEQPRESISTRLVEWIEAIPDRAMIVSDAPDYDFELLKPLLTPWPRNLANQAMTFDRYATGVDRQFWLQIQIGRYYTPERPEHHALHDAQALRAGMMAALDHGWVPK